MGGLMKVNLENLSKQIDTVCQEWEVSGAFMVTEKGQIIHSQSYGYADRDLKIQTKRDSRYRMILENPFFMGLCSFILMDQGRLKLDDKLSQFIPEFQHADKITIEDILRSRSGIMDFFYEHVMVELEHDETLKAASEKERRIAEELAYIKNAQFTTVMEIIRDKDLQYVPGTIGLSESQTNWILLAEVIRRITNQPLFEFLSRNVFEPLQMTNVTLGQEADTVNYVYFKKQEWLRVPLDQLYEGLMTVTAEDMEKLLVALSTGKVLSKKMWKQVFNYDEEGMGLVFEDANGYHCSNMGFMNSGFFFYINHESQTGFASLVNEEQKMVNIDSQWYYFRRVSREIIESAFTYPVKPKLVKLSEKNLWDALNLTVEKEQLNYVLEAKSSVAMALMYRSKQGYVLTEGTRAIGLLVLEMDHKKNHYNIDIILIDKKFQGRGYGKVMLNWAIERLKKEGAKELEIGVNRFNHAAKKIYMDAGFTPKSVYEEGMTLHMVLE